MPAFVDITRWTGPITGPTKTVITSTNTRAGTADQHSTDDTTHPIQLSASVTRYSYWVTARLTVNNVMVGTINNMRLYAEGEYPESPITCIGQIATSYQQATGTPGVTGNPLNTTNHVGTSSPPVDVATFTPSAPKAIPGQISTNEQGDFGDWFVFQYVVPSGATPGRQGKLQFTWMWDET